MAAFENRLACFDALGWILVSFLAAFDSQLAGVFAHGVHLDSFPARLTRLIAVFGAFVTTRQYLATCLSAVGLDRCQIAAYSSRVTAHFHRFLDER